MIKVAHIITQLDLGGAQKNTLYTVDNLDRSKFNPILIYGDHGQLKPPLFARLYPIRWLVRPINPLADVAALGSLISILRKEKPDIVHTHSSKAGILGRLAAKAAGVPAIVHTYHGFGFHDHMSPWKKRSLVKLERFVAQFTNEIIYVSWANRLAAAREGIGHPNKNTLIRSGIDLSAYPAKVSKRDKKIELGVNPDKPLIVSVGNLKPQKNVEAFEILAADLEHKAEFVFVGGDYVNTYSNLKFLGWRDDVPEILAAADIFVLTSLWEGLPRSLVEAMKTGLACVCYPTDGVRDLLHTSYNGYLANDVDELCKQVEYLIDNVEQRRYVGRMAQICINDEFDIRNMVKRIEGLYETVMSEATK